MLMAVVLAGPGAPPDLCALLESQGCRMRNNPSPLAPDLFVPTSSSAIFVVGLDPLSGPVLPAELDSICERAVKTGAPTVHIAAVVSSSSVELFYRLQHDCLSRPGLPLPFPCASLVQLAEWLTPLLRLWEPNAARAVTARIKEQSVPRALPPTRVQRLLSSMVGGPTAVLHTPNTAAKLEALGSLSALASATVPMLDAFIHDYDTAMSVRAFFDEDYPVV